MTALSGTHFTAYVPSAPVPPARVGRQEVDTSVLNGFPDSQQFWSRPLFIGHPVGGFVIVGCPRSGCFLRSCNTSSFSFRVFVGYSPPPLHPTTTDASPGPFMDILSRRLRAGSPSAHLDFVDETIGVFPGHHPKSCRMVLPSSFYVPDSRAILRGRGFICYFLGCVRLRTLLRRRHIPPTAQCRQPLATPLMGPEVLSVCWSGKFRGARHGRRCGSSISEVP